MCAGISCFPVEKLPNELIITVLETLDPYNILFLIKFLPSSHKVYECSLFLLLHTIQVYYDSENKKLGCFEDIFEIADEYHDCTRGSFKEFMKPIFLIHCENLPKILKYQSAIKKLVICERKDRIVTRAPPLIDDKNFEIIQSFLNNCSNIHEVENASGLNLRYPNLTEILSETGEYSSKTHDGCTIVLRNLSPEIKQLNIKWKRIAFDSKACFLKLTYLVIEFHSLKDFKDLLINRYRFPSLKKSVLRCDKPHHLVLVGMGLETMNTIDSSCYEAIKKILPKQANFLKSFKQNLVINRCGTSMILEILQDCKALKTIDLSGNRITLINNMFYKFENLISLKLESNHIRNIKNLSGLVNLEWLSVAYKQIERVESLDLPRLKSLSMSGNRLEDVGYLHRLKNSKELGISCNSSLKSFKCLYQLKTLVILHCDRGYENQYHINFERLPKLRTLNTGLNYLQFSEPIIFPNLEKFVVKNYKNLRMSILSAKFPILKELDLTGIKINDITPVGDMIHLEFCMLSHSGVKDIRCLGKCAKLRELNLSDNHIMSIDGISNLKFLGFLDIQYNKEVYWEDVVFNWPSMTYLNLCGCNIHHFPSLVTPKLLKLDLSFNANLWRELDRLKEIKSLRYLVFRHISPEKIKEVPGQIVRLESRSYYSYSNEITI
ncbi:hypothetical protein DASC09_028600 [Saccharomycopsis crataegensis]|uniref:F-box domain-containing protein n=1 Tax=Saccharomycopsis crataegensis TaxID=43959 RepID=A0AAV5QLW4_9ASCO|nr:hypothetical protein DASC09_028600 [Saccharomycopsis crataegensis]